MLDSGMQEWLIKQWHDISGNFKFWILLIVGAAIMSGVTALIHGLSTWQQVVLVALFALMLGWALIATFSTNPTRPFDVTTGNVESSVRQWLHTHSHLSKHKS